MPMTMPWSTNLLEAMISTKGAKRTSATIWQVVRVAGELEEEDILHSYGAGRKPAPGEDGAKMRADDVELGLEAAKLVIGGDDSGPDLALGCGEGFGGTPSGSTSLAAMIAYASRARGHHRRCGWRG
jgi:hypothetical protein